MGCWTSSCCCYCCSVWTHIVSVCMGAGVCYSSFNAARRFWYTNLYEHGTNWRVTVGLIIRMKNHFISNYLRFVSTKDDNIAPLSRWNLIDSNMKIISHWLAKYAQFCRLQYESILDASLYCVFGWMCCDDHLQYATIARNQLFWSFQGEKGNSLFDYNWIINFNLMGISR